MTVPLPGAVVRLRVLVATFGILTVLFAGATFLARWYQRERLARAQKDFEIGEALEGKGREKQAIGLYGDALAIVSRPEYRLAMARALIKLDRPAEASLYLHEILQNDPAEAYPNLLLARIAVSGKENDQAINYYQRAIYGRWRTNPERRSLDARWELAGFLIRTQSRNAAVAELLQIADQEQSSEARVKAADMLLGLRAPNQAAEILRSVLRTDPQNTAALAQLGRAEMALGDYAQARTAFRNALRQNPADNESRLPLEQAEAILALDPTERGLSAAQRYARSRQVLQRALAGLVQCSKPDAARQSIDAANRLLETRAPEDANLTAAEQLWETRARVCGAAAPQDEVLARVLARISK